jgi:Variant SH3 domain
MIKSRAYKPTKYRVIKAYQSPYPDSLIFKKGDIVEVGKPFTGDPEWGNWLWCVGTDNLKAWVPKQYLNIIEKKGILNKDYNARELSVDVGENLFVHEIVNGFGMAEKANGKKGWVPMKYLEPDDS